MLKYQNFDINVKIMIHELLYFIETLVFTTNTLNQAQQQQKTKTCTIFGYFEASQKFDL